MADPIPEPLCRDIHIVSHGTINYLLLESALKDRIIEAQSKGKAITFIKDEVAKGEPKSTCFRTDENGVLWFW